MLDHKVSPLLDAMEVGECFARHDGASCYLLLHPESGREFVLKQISVPASAEQVSALLLTGAYASEEEAEAYYRKEAEALVREAEARKKLLDCPYILPFLGVQMEKNDVGYAVYDVLPKRNSLEAYLRENAVSHLRGINMGIDLCVALSALREEGFVHGNLKPGNVFFSYTGRFLLGDFGLIPTQDIQYAILPEQYRSSYSAPELGGILGGLNPTVDIYSLGMILYRIYNGNHAPFEDEQTGVKAAEARRLAGEELPAPLYADYELAAIIKKACAPDPADRYQTPEEMRTELETYMRRNAVSDHLIVPPLVHDDEPLTAEEVEEPTEPVRFADPEAMDPAFKKAFSPDEKRDEKDRKEKKKEDASAELASSAQSAAPTRKADKRQRRRKRAWIVFSTVMVLVVAFLALYEFTDLGKGFWHYFVTVESLEVEDLTADGLKLHLTTNANADDFTAYCQDAYGNSVTAAFQDGVAAFSALKPNTQYTLKVELPGLHRVSGTTSISAITGSQTEILRMEAVPGAQDGSVALTLTVREGDEKPAFWTLTYGKKGETPVEVQFAGERYLLSDLEVGAEYTFTLQGSEKLFLAGQTQAVCTPVKAVRIEALELESVLDGAARVTWLCTTDLPEGWELHCADPDGKEISVTPEEAVQENDGWHCAAAVTGIEPDVTYALTLSAEGVAQPLRLTILDERITVADFTATASAGSLSLRWSANREREAGWLVTAVFDGDQKLEAVVHGDQCELTVLPDLDYELTLACADGTELEGVTTASVHSQPTQRFTQLGLTTSTTIGTYYTPNKENWSYWELGGGTVRYRHNDRITFLITAGGWPVNSDAEMTVMYVVRTAATEKVVNLQTETLVWNEMWDGNKWAAQIPWLPETPGSYTFSVYLNGQRLGTIPFTLIQ